MIGDDATNCTARLLGLRPNICALPAKFHLKTIVDTPRFINYTDTAIVVFHQEDIGVYGRKTPCFRDIGGIDKGTACRRKCIRDVDDEFMTRFSFWTYSAIINYSEHNAAMAQLQQYIQANLMQHCRLATGGDRFRLGGILPPPFFFR